MTGGNGQYGQVPVALMLDTHNPVRQRHLAVFAALHSCVSFTTRRGEVRLRRIVERSHVGPREVRRVLLELEAWGYVIVHRRAGRPNLYVLTDPAGEANAPRLPGLELAAAEPQAGKQPRGQRAGVVRGQRAGVGGASGHDSPEVSTEKRPTAARVNGKSKSDPDELERELPPPGTLYVIGGKTYDPHEPPAGWAANGNGKGPA